MTKDQFRILMLGWEFPPYFGGGVGIVCYQLSKALCNEGTKITFVMPSAPKEAQSDFLRLIIADHYAFDESALLEFRRIDSLLAPYATEASYQEAYEQYVRKIIANDQEHLIKLYGKNLLEEIWLFARKVTLFNFAAEDYDLIHAHDWTTFPAAVELKKQLKRPLAVHMHITEYDKNGGHAGDQRIHDTERYGMDNADIIICISERIKQACVEKYEQDPAKCVVLYNGAEDIPLLSVAETKIEKIEEKDKVVLFAGRVTLQKGPQYFMEAARRVHELMPEGIKFVVAGTGDMLPRCVQMAEEYGMLSEFIFTGFFTRQTAFRLFNRADLFVMPSVSEPFGIVPLEAMWADTPAITSLQSGVSEVLDHVIKVDFWDVDRMADAMVHILQDKMLQNELKKHGKVEVRAMTWDVVAKRCIEIYQRMHGGGD